MNTVRNRMATRALREEHGRLSERLAVAEETLRAIRCGEVDALFSADRNGELVAMVGGAESGHRVLVEAMNEGAAILSNQGLLLYCNSRLASLLHAPLEAVMGNPLSAFVDGASQAPVGALLRQGLHHACTGDVCFRDLEGAVTPVQLSLSPMRIHELPAICLVANDLTEHKRVERELRDLSAGLERRVQELHSKNEEVEAFVYVVSHDLRAPLVNLQGFARELGDSCARLRTLLKDSPQGGTERAEVDGILDEEIPGALHFIYASSAKFERLIDALLGLSRQGREVYRVAEVDMEELARNTVAVMRRLIVEAGATVEIGDLPAAQGDATALEQVFANLIGNCLKYRCPERLLKLEVGGQLEGEKVHYWVKDNGLGIPEFGKARLFQVFQRLHPDRAPGEGMGLAIAHRIVERHRGRIWAESEEGAGSVFHFSLPASPQPVSEVADPTGAMAPMG